MNAKDLFLISGGGTGAKVVEAMVHLCAAGLGPARMHVLLIDSDTANGNLGRARDTILAYQRMKRWPWSIRSRVRQGTFSRREEVWLDLFRTEITFHELTEPIATVRDGGLEMAGSRDENLRLALDLLYDEDEQTTTCEDGFRARPNLGCLLLADHLAQRLPAVAAGFLTSLRASVGARPDRVPVVVAASVFGGTGASLLPIARRAVERALGAEVKPDQLERLHWGAVKLLPHYRPAERLESVDPDRFLLDTSGALQFYSSVYATTDERHRYHGIFLVGSDDPSRNSVKARLGHSLQANPAYVEEVVASLAALRFAATPSRPDRPTHLLTEEQLSWATLPHPERDVLKEQLGYLLHLAAFYLRQGDPRSAEQRSTGLARLLRDSSSADLRLYPWFQKILDPWAEFVPAYKTADDASRIARLRDRTSMQEHSIDSMLRHAGEYFGRLLLWAEGALTGENLSFLEQTPSSDYADMHTAMADVSAADVDTQRGEGNETVMVQPQMDNAVVRVLRTAAHAMVREHRERTRRIFVNPRFTLVSEGPDGRIQIRTTQQETEDLLRDLDLSTIIDEYRRTRLA
jgi:hypothetical protein